MPNKNPWEVLREEEATGAHKAMTPEQLLTTRVLAAARSYIGERAVESARRCGSTIGRPRVSAAAILAAVKDVSEGASQRAAAKKHGVKESTLRRRLYGPGIIQQRARAYLQRERARLARSIRGSL